MNTQNIIKLGLFTLIASFGISNPVFADHHGKEGSKKCNCSVKGKMGKWKSQKGTHGNFFLKFKDELKLDATQTAKLEGISTAFQTEQEKNHASVSEKKKMLNEKAMGDKFDAKEVARLSSQIGDLHGKMLENRYLKLHEASSVLSADQKKVAWERMEAKHAHKMEKGKAMKKKGKKKGKKAKRMKRKASQKTDA